MRIPQKGRKWSEISTSFRNFEKESYMDARSRKRQLQHVYALSGQHDLRTIALRTYQRFMDSNPSYDTEHGILQMERDVIEMLSSLWNCEGGVGHMTSCGTESNILALYAARKISRLRRGGSVVLPSTAHMSLFKGCDYLRLRPIVVPVGDDFRADAEAMAQAIEKDTVAMAATAGNWAWGQIDPIEKLGKVAEGHSLYFHVDAAYAGLFCPFLDDTTGSQRIPTFDFRVRGVSSLSSDPHKNGYAPVPAGAIVFRDASIAKAAGYSTPSFLGYEYETPGFVGTRPGFAIAGTWAFLNHLGFEGYARLSRKAMKMTLDFIHAVGEIPGLSASCVPTINFATASSSSIEMDEVKSTMRRKGWLFYDQMGRAKTKENAIVAAILPDREAIYPKFLADLSDSVKKRTN